MTPHTTADVDPLDVLARTWVAVLGECLAHEGEPDEERWLGVVAGLQLAVAAVSGVPVNTRLRAGDVIRAGGDIARARIDAIRDGS